MLNEERCWQAVLDRDRNEDGHFVFGVTTTGIFCRPSCAARRPLRKNVRFFPDTDEAQAQGLRPCRRCHPLDTSEDRRVEQIRSLCDFIRENCDSGDPLTLEILARRIHVTPSRLRRLFQEIVGLSPRQYVEACRFDTLKNQLKQGENVTDAIYGAGFGSSSRVYDQTESRLGMTPGQYRAGGEGLAISYALASTPVGRMLVAATDRGLCSVQLGDSDEELLALLQEEFPAAQLEPMSSTGSAPFGHWVEALQEHLKGRLPHLDLPLDIRASAFRRKVWEYLQTIPYGETRSYTEVAEAIGRPEAVRAVASACAANRTALVIPCHRVLRANGALSGYRWGVERKRRLLEREAETLSPRPGERSD